MPPRTRGNKGIKTLKENINVVLKTKSKLVSKVGKPPRKALADKTNSASDDNASIEVSKKVSQNAAPVKISNIAPENPPRSRRERRLPVRYVENNVLKNLSNNKNDTDFQVVISNAVSISEKAQTPVKNASVTISPFKTPQRDLENSLMANKHKRISRLPSKFDDHVISPSIKSPVQPCHASTPILWDKQSKSASATYKTNKKNVISKLNKEVEVSKKTGKKRHFEDSSDTNNNAKGRSLRNKKLVKPPENPVPVEHEISVKEKISPRLKTRRKGSKKIPETNFSFRVLENKKQLSQKDGNYLDVYEFTYDPNEEPPPAKKKRKRAVRKKPTQPRTVVFKNNYDKNVAKALEALKNVVSKKPNVPKVVITPGDYNSKALQNKQTVELSIPKTMKVVSEQIKPQGLPICDNKNSDIAIPTNQTVNLTNEDKNYNSVRVEDIAADFDISMDNYNDIDYSPVNSPNRVKTPIEIDRNNIPVISSVHNKDPLNLRDDLSFFGDYPIASSSMNISARHPEASPWRVEFNNLPIKWQVNTYVKPNMTPAVESSFINTEENKKKHVYTNIMAEDNELMPETESNNPSNLKQTSIISYIREVAERSAKKKRKVVAVTPTKENSLFNEVSTRPGYFNDKTPKKALNNAVNDKYVHKKTAENISSSNSDDKENSKEIKGYKKKEDKSIKKDKNGTFFGFDDSEDQENVSPEKMNNPKVRALRPRARAVLQEINAVTGPMRAELPVAARSKVTASSDAVNKVYEEMTAADAPVFPEKYNDGEETNDDATPNTDVNDDDSLSMHLFEDIEVVHHLKPTRKSYGKAKKVTFQQQSASGDPHDLNSQTQESSDGDDLADLTFTMPSVQQKKPKKKLTKKQKMSKKEEQAMEAWAAGFNSMCEDIEEVPLIVE